METQDVGSFPACVWQPDKHDAEVTISSVFRRVRVEDMEFEGVNAFELATEILCALRPDDRQLSEFLRKYR